MKALTVPVRKHPNGKQVIPADPEAIPSFLALKGLDWEGELTLSDKKKKRTRGDKDDEGSQDGFYFGPINKVLREEIWFTLSKEEAYIRTLEQTSYRMERNPRGGKPIKVLIHVSDMDRAQMAKHIEDVQMWAAQEHGVFIPDADPTKSKRWAATFRARGYATMHQGETT